MIRLLGIYSAFHHEARHGNSAAIFSGAADTDQELMQACVREQHATVGVLLSATDGTYGVRYFSAASELPYCVHGTLCLAKHLLPAEDTELAVRARCMDIVLARRESAYFCSAEIPAFERTKPFDADGLLDALGIVDDDLRQVVRVVDAGSPKALVEVNNLEKLVGLKVNADRLIQWSRTNEVAGAYVHYALGTGFYAARSFNPQTGIYEDRATGVAAAALMFALSGRHRNVEILQGADPATACTIHAFVSGSSIWIGGAVNPLVREKSTV
ncbi:MAG: PhzF family phenazine biosynthesis protein [Betaproteobacteria bacterium]